jgi:hypothetical protein
LDIIERVQAYAVTRLEAGGVEASDELTDYGACLAGGDEPRGVRGVDVDLGNALIELLSLQIWAVGIAVPTYRCVYIIMRLVEHPTKQVFIRDWQLLLC